MNANTTARRHTVWEQLPTGGWLTLTGFDFVDEAVTYAHSPELAGKRVRITDDFRRWYSPSDYVTHTFGPKLRSTPRHAAKWPSDARPCNPRWDDDRTGTEALLMQPTGKPRHLRG